MVELLASYGLTQSLEPILSVCIAHMLTIDYFFRNYLVKPNLVLCKKMTVEALQELQAEVDTETENDISNDGDDTEDPDNEMGVGGNSAKTPVSLLQVL